VVSLPDAQGVFVQAKEKFGMYMTNGFGLSEWQRGYFTSRRRLVRETVHDIGKANLA